ncbi:MAG: PKD domain-containing protein [Bacteroidota bacterium]
MKLHIFQKFKVWKALILSLFLFCLLTSCDEEEDPTPDTLIVNAGSDQIVEVGQTATLDGSGSSDTGGNSITYLWAFSSVPSGSTASISNTTSAMASFSPDVEGTYTAILTVSNADGSKTDEVTITATAPAAVAVELSGSRTEDLRLTDIFVNSSVPDYIVTSNFRMRGGVLTIDPGVTIAFKSDQYMWIEDTGAIIAKGTTTNPIVFTGETETKGFWRGLVIWSNNTQNELDYVEIKYAGSNDHGSGVPSIGLALGNSGQAKITNSTVTNNAGDYGMFVELGTDLNTFSNNTISNNDGTALGLAIFEATKLDPASSFNTGNGDNSIEIFSQSNIDLDGEKTLPTMADGTPYYVSGNIRLRNGGLVVSPGAVLEFNTDVYFWIEDNGYMIAKGTDTEPIVFTGKVKQKGYWRGIAFWSSNVLNELDYAEVSYGGSSDHGSGLGKIGLGLGNSGKLKVSNTAITNSDDIGFQIESTTTLESFSNNSFSDNNGVPMSLDANNAGELDNATTFTNNGDNAIEIYSSTKSITDLTTWPKINDGTPYYISGNIRVRGGGLKVEAGATFEFASNAYMWIEDDAYLDAIGTASDKITFTGRTKQAGSWRGLVIWTNNVLNQIDHAEFSYGGSSSHGSGVDLINLGVGNSGRLNVANSNFSNSAGFGIYAESTATINADAATVNTFSNNTGGDIQID